MSCIGIILILIIIIGYLLLFDRYIIFDLIKTSQNEELLKAVIQFRVAILGLSALDTLPQPN